jgi:hypothetical protein
MIFDIFKTNARKRSPGMTIEKKFPSGSADLPDPGQISSTADFQKSSPSCKNISVFPKPNQLYRSRHPVPLEGRFARSSRT